MNKRKQAKYGKQGGLTTGPTKKRDIDYAALARLSHQKRKQTKESK
jgi:hypothetical protein